MRRLRSFDLIRGVGIPVVLLSAPSLVGRIYSVFGRESAKEEALALAGR